MKFLYLVRAGLWRRPLRSVLTMLAVMIAFLLFGVMHGVVAQFDDAIADMSEVRLRVMSRANILESIPVAYQQRIERVDGVRIVTPVVVFFGFYQDQSQPVSGGAIALEGFLEVMQELSVSPAQVDAVRANRIGLVAGTALVEKYGWKIGDRIPIKSQLWMNQDSGQDWTFELVAIAHPTEPEDELFAQEVYVRYDYLDEARVRERGTVNQFIVAIEDPSQSVRVAEQIDALFANSADETQTFNEKDYLRSRLEQVGDISAFVYSILGAVSFTLFFLTATTLLQSMRERIPELGILKSLGFTSGTLYALLTVEAVVLCLAGAGLGLLLAGLAFPAVFSAFGLGMALGPGVYLLGFALAAVLALLVSAWPAWRAHRLDVVAAIGGR